MCHACRRVVTAITVLVLVALAYVAPAGRALAEIPRGNDPAAYTEHEFRRALLAFHQRTLAGAYREVGKRDPRWDGHAEALLDAMAVYFTYGGADARYRAQKSPTRDQALRLAQTARDAGCNDPLVAYCELAVTHDEIAAASRGTDTLEARTHLAAQLRQAVEGLMARNYPPHRVCEAARRLRWLYDPMPARGAAPIMVTDADRGRCQTILWDFWLAAAADNALGGDNRRFLWMTVGEDMLDQPLDRQAQLLEALRQLPDADPWFVNTFGGFHHVKRAWEKRGSGFAHTVTDEGWAGFYEQMAKARDCLVKACEHDPRHPEPAAKMIEVAMGAGERLDTTTREWFDRAVAAQLDFHPAYHHLFWSLRPRWNGSHQQMYALGLECLATERYDTRIPWYLIAALKDIVNDEDGRYTFWRRRGVADKLSECLGGYAAATATIPPGGKGDAYPPEWYRSFEVAALWRAGDVDAAAALLAELEKDRHFWPQAVAELDAWPGRVAEEVRAMAGPLGPQVRAAEQFAISGMVANAASEFQDLLHALDKPDALLKPTDPAARFIRVRAKEINLYQRLNAGHTVSIQPDEEMLGWYTWGGTWAVEGERADAAVVGTDDHVGSTSMVLLMYLPVGNRYEIAGRYELGPDDAPGAFATVHDNRSMQYNLLLDRGTDQVSVARWIDAHRASARAVDGLPDAADFVIRVWDGRVTLLLNNDPAIRHYPFYSGAPPQRSHFALGGLGTQAATTMRFTRLTLKRLTEPPEGVDPPPQHPPAPPLPEN